MKTCVIGKKYGFSKRGSYTVSKRFADLFDDFEFRVDTSIKNILLEKYDKFIFTFQRCSSYSFPFNLNEIRSIDHLVYTRDKLHACVLNSATNGFSMYKSMKCHKHFIPFITDFSVEFIPQNEPVLGFYTRVHVNPDAIQYLKKEIQDCKYPINLVTFGDNTVDFHLKNVKSFYHTYDNVDFFSRITHYYFPKSAEFVDPFPNALLEAIQTNKQIICPTISGRTHLDGIDDILIFAKYHSKLEDMFSDVYYDNSSCPLVFSNFRSYYNKLLDNDFCTDVQYDTYKDFYDWCSSEL